MRQEETTKEVLRRRSIGKLCHYYLQMLIRVGQKEDREVYMLAVSAFEFID